MILQVKQGGSWSNVVEFELEHQRQVEEATIPLAQVLEIRARAIGSGSPSWRIIVQRARSPRVLRRLEAPSFKWSKA